MIRVKLVFVLELGEMTFTIVVELVSESYWELGEVYFCVEEYKYFRLS